VVRDADLLALLAAERGGAAQPITESLLTTAAAALTSDPELGPVVTAAYRLLRRTAPWALQLAPALVGAIASIAKDADRLIFTETELGLAERPSLRAVAAQVGLSKDAGRRSRERIAAHVRAHAASSTAPLGWAVGHTFRALGAAAPVNVVADLAVKLKLPELPGRAAASRKPMDSCVKPESAVDPLDVLLWLAGPYRFDGRVTDWVVRNQRPGTPDLVTLTRATLRAEGGVRHAKDVCAVLRAAGVTDELIVPWINANGAAVLDGGATAWLGGQLVGAIELLIDAAGRAVSESECTELCRSGGRRVSQEDVARALQARRFRRLKSGKYELATWPPSAGARRSSRRAPASGPHPQPDPWPDSAEQRLFARLGMFAPDGSDVAQHGSGAAGMSRRATAWQERRSPDTGQRPASDDVDGDTRVWFVVVVDADVLSGAAGSAPEQLIRGLGIGWHQRRTFASRYGPVTLSNADAVPSHSTLRPLALGTGADKGDRLNLGFGMEGDLVVELEKCAAGVTRR
jgi:hypothetical protein